jgi:hypothetical protein
MARRCLDGAEFIKHAILAVSVTAENQDLAPRSRDVVTAQAIVDRHQIMHRVPVEDAGPRSDGARHCQRDLRSAGALNYRTWPGRHAAPTGSPHNSPPACGAVSGNGRRRRGGKSGRRSSIVIGSSRIISKQDGRASQLKHIVFGRGTINEN